MSATLTPRDHADRLEKSMRCNCDLDNWEPERLTGHSQVCRIHKAANEARRMDNSAVADRPGGFPGKEN